MILLLLDFVVKRSLRLDTMMELIFLHVKNSTCREKIFYFWFFTHVETLILLRNQLSMEILFLSIVDDSSLFSRCFCRCSFGALVPTKMCHESLVVNILSVLLFKTF